MGIFFELYEVNSMNKFFTFFLFSVFSVAVFAQASNWEWQNSKPTGNDLRSVIFNQAGDLFVLGNAGTVCRSTNNGLTWNLSVVDTGYRDIYEAMFVNANTGFLCGYGGLIMKTTDGGKTWVEKPSGVTTNLWYLDFVTPDTGYAVGSSATVLKTTNGGETWTAKLLGTTATLYKVYMVNASTGYLGTSNSTQGYLCKTTDYGNTWTKVASYPGASGVYGIYFIDANTGFTSDAAYCIYKTTDGGATWNLISDYGSGTLYEFRFASATDGAVCGSRGEVWVTKDAGASWTKTQNPYNTSLYALGINPTTKRLVTAGNGGVISTSTDWGTNWSMISTSATVQQLKRIQFLNSKVGYTVGGSAVASDSLGEIIKTTNGGSTWNKLAFNPKSRVYSQFWLNENVGWIGVAGANGIYKTTDGGANFTATTVVGMTSAPTWYEIEFVDANLGYAVGQTGTMVKSTDGGLTWNSLVSPFGTTIIYSMKVLDANTIVAVGGSGKGYKSTDGGATWTALSLGTGSLYQVSFLDKNIGMVVGSSGAVYKTTDGGTTWTALVSGSTATLYAGKFQDKNIAWFGGSGGDIRFTTDGGATWNKTKLFLSSSTVYDITIKEGYIWMTNDGGAIVRNYSDPTVIPVELTAFTANVSGNYVKLNWNTATETNNKGYFVERKGSADEKWSSISFVNGKGNSTTISEYSFIDKPETTGKYSYRLKQVDFDGTFNYSGVVEANMTAPKNFDLTQNFPNPFNPSTTIRYSVPVASKVTVKVFDILGKEVASLVNEMKQAGNYEVMFNASQLSSGIYFYKLQAGSFNATKKLTLIK